MGFAFYEKLGAWEEEHLKRSSIFAQKPDFSSFASSIQVRMITSTSKVTPWARRKQKFLLFKVSITVNGEKVKMPSLPNAANVALHVASFTLLDDSCKPSGQRVAEWHTPETGCMRIEILLTPSSEIQYACLVHVATEKLMRSWN